MIRLHGLQAVDGPIDQLRSLEMHPVAGLLVDTRPKLAEVLPKMDLLVEIHVALLVGVGDAVLEDVSLHLIEDRRTQDLRTRRALKAEEDVIRVEGRLDVAGCIEVALRLKRAPKSGLTHLARSAYPCHRRHGGEAWRRPGARSGRI